MSEMPPRQHYLKFQASVPVNKTKQSAQAIQKVIDSAATHLKAVAGGGARNVVVRCFYQDRGPGQTGIVWRDLLVVCGFDGTLTSAANELMTARITFEFDKAAKAQAKGETRIIDITAGSPSGKKVIA